MFFDPPKTGRRSGWVRVVLACLAGVAPAGCGPAPAPAGRDGAPDGPRVLATTTIVADLVRQVGGDRVTVDCLMRPGIDPHSYRATPRDADRLAAADLIVASGLHLEGRLATILERLARTRPVVSVGDRLPADRLLDAGGGAHDPHVWFDPRLWALAAPVVAEALAALDPAAAEDYRSRATAYAADLAAVDARLRDEIARVPAPGRVLVTAHDAFRYFGRAFGVEVIGVQGTSTESEAGLGDINRLVDLLVRRGIPAVFVETSVSDRDVAALREGARARGHEVSLGGRLFSDSLGGPGSGAETLVDALAANVATIVAGLGGEETP